MDGLNFKQQQPCEATALKTGTLRVTQQNAVSKNVDRKSVSQAKGNMFCRVSIFQVEICFSKAMMVSKKRYNDQY